MPRGYGDLIAAMGLSARRGSVRLGSLRLVVGPIEVASAARMMVLRVEWGVGCNAGHLCGRAPARLVDDRGGMRSAVRVRGCGARAHDVSILIATRGAVGEWRGWQPAWKVSMTIMRPPQQGHG